MIPVREYTADNVHEMLARYKALSAQARPKPKPIIISEIPVVAVKELAPTTFLAPAGMGYVPRDKRGPQWRSAQSRAQRILRRVAHRHGVKAHLIYSDSLDSAVVEARHHAMYRIWVATGWTYRRLGAFFGASDHRTAHRVVQAFRAGVNGCRGQLEAKQAKAHAKQLEAKRRKAERESARRLARRITRPHKQVGAPAHDITGQRFGNLTVLRLSHKDNYYRRYWHVRCDCGTETVARGDRMKSAHTRGCGCLAWGRAA